MVVVVGAMVVELPDAVELDEVEAEPVVLAGRLPVLVVLLDIEEDRGSSTNFSFSNGIAA